MNTYKITFEVIAENRNAAVDEVFERLRNGGEPDQIEELPGLYSGLEEEKN